MAIIPRAATHHSKWKYPVILKGNMSEGDPPSDRARVTGAINCVNSMLLTRINCLTNDLLEGAHFLVKSIPTEKKVHNTQRDQNVAGAPEIGCGERKPCACTESRTCHPILSLKRYTSSGMTGALNRAQGRVGTHTIRTHKSIVDKVAWAHTRSAHTTP